MQLEEFLDLDLFLLKYKWCFYKNRVIVLYVISGLPLSSHIFIFHAYELVLYMIFEQEDFLYVWNFDTKYFGEIKLQWEYKNMS